MALVICLYEAAELFRRQHQRGIDHAQRSSDFPLQQIGIRHARPVGRHLSKQPEAQVAIGERRVRRLRDAAMPQVGVEIGCVVIGAGIGIRRC